VIYRFFTNRVLGFHRFGDADVSVFARKEAAETYLRRVCGMSTMLNNAILNTCWHLVPMGMTKSQVQTHRIDSLPFLVGRDHSVGLYISSDCVSKRHAEISENAGQLFVRDVGSKNGTFVNGELVHDTQPLKDGDLIQFADTPLRLTRQNTSVSQTVGTESCDMALALSQFDQLIEDKKSVVPFLQPIVGVDESELIAYEILGRSNLYGLAKPDIMFRTAKHLGMEAQLSRHLRCCGLEVGMRAGAQAHLFVNTHPKELEDVRSLVASLIALRKSDDQQQITIEIHESTVAKSETMRLLRLVLKDLEMGLAYDDFGAGQSRLAEIADVPPDVLKFDISLIRGIHQAPEKRQEMLGALVRMTKELGAVTLAEGVEFEGEAVVCRQLGFQLFQGFHHGLPKKASEYLNVKDPAPPENLG
jgi:EAL domain-containing protein (putative c-di-GMP-specific phosphodiesterase class I)